MKKCIIIPARISSTRLPKKVMLKVGGKPIIQRVYEQCSKVKNISVYIATDSLEIMELCNAFTTNVIMTKSSHKSGTDRVVEAMGKLTDYDLIVNVQADEPFINPILIDEIFKNLTDKNVLMVSAMKKINSIKDLKNPNIVKVITDKNKNAIYFSRSIIPHLRDQKGSTNKFPTENNPFYSHIGIYGYKKEFLHIFSNLKEGPLEELEKLEQLRVIENGIKIRMIETKLDSIGIDTKEDYLNSLNFYEKQKKQYEL